MKKSTALKTLGLSEGASDEDIKKVHRKLIIENHPDKFGQDAAARAKAEEKTKLINEARDVLLNHSWDPEYASAGTAYGAPFSYDPFAAAYGQNPFGGRSARYAAKSQGSAGNPRGTNPSGNPFNGWPFGETFVWTTWDSSGQQHTYTSSTSTGRTGATAALTRILLRALIPTLILLVPPTPVARATILLAACSTCSFLKKKHLKTF